MYRGRRDKITAKASDAKERRSHSAEMLSVGRLYLGMRSRDAILDANDVKHRARDEIEPELGLVVGS